eukprot:365702-Chlamydomonas_euryale.AAC.14
MSSSSPIAKPRPVPLACASDVLRKLSPASEPACLGDTVYTSPLSPTCTAAPTIATGRGAPGIGATSACTSELSGSAPDTTMRLRSVITCCSSQRRSGRAPYAGSYAAAVACASAASESARLMFFGCKRLPSSATSRRAMPPSWAALRGSNTTMSSSRLRNSGRKKVRTADSTWARAAARAAGSSALPDAASASSASLPRFDVMMTIVLAKFTVRPLASVTRPSSRMDSSTLKTSACAFSTSSNSSTE